MPTKNHDQLDLFADSVPVSDPIGPIEPVRPMTEHIQSTFAEISEEYKVFEAKFKPKKTTDDCYTPGLVYNAVRDYVCRRYSVDPATIVRPFYPGGDYERHDYPDGCVVLDNPPFSILSKIVRYYVARGIRFWLFAPALTTFVGGVQATAVCAGCNITYANGAVVNTSFLTNLEDREIVAMSAPELHDLVESANAESRREQVRHVPKLAMPLELVTSARMNYYSIHVTDYIVRRSDSIFVRKLDNYPSGIFGGGLLVNRRAAAERAAAERAAAERAA
ncbi:MAG: hypothetical protein IIZ51_06785, partial [Lachnospiraceae bacterium]|nr:hypothetical protein [Lachnospiraceae bacterium]